ncbi:MAG: hypothetical protein ACI8XO_004916 [Verrucomicrobiales bacterium]|jgi:hypothetical protein
MKDAKPSRKECLHTAIGFLVYLGATNFLMAFYWQATMPGSVYYCTDAFGMDYLFPGSWVHGDWVYTADVEATGKKE